MRAIALVCLIAVAGSLCSCGLLMELDYAAYRHMGRDPKRKTYIPDRRNFGGINGREIWLHSPKQLEDTDLMLAADQLNRLTADN